MNDTRRHALVLLGLLLVGLAVRVYGAWLCRYDTSSDRGRVGIMALHMAQGRDWPVFFYGGAYLGSVEPAASALFIRALGPSGFALNLGTAAFGFLLLLLLYKWGRETGGPVAGLVAVALSLVGPFGYFYFLASPRGGYAATLFFGSVVLWLAGRIFTKAQSGSNPAHVEILAAGLAAGLAWWSHQLSAAALATAALAIAWGAGRKTFSPRYGIGGLAFFVASAPWWIWNATHDWATLKLGGSFGSAMPLHTGLRMFFGERLPEVYDFAPLSSNIASAFTVVALLGVLAGLGALGARIRRLGPSLRRCHVTVIVLFVLVSAILYAGSHYALNRSTRYLLPLLPPLAVMVGAAVSLFRHRVVRASAMGLVLLIVVGQAVSVRKAFVAERGKDAPWHDVPKLVEFCRQQDIEVLYGNIWQHWINFASAERCTVCDLMAEPYAPYARAAERATRCGLLGNFENLAAFLAATCATGQISTFEHLAVQHDFQPSNRHTSPLPTEKIVRVTDESGRDLEWLCDFAAGSHEEWTISPNTPNGKEISISLAEPQAIAGVRIRCIEHYYPWLVTIEGRISDSEAWQTLLPETHGTLFFWSGPRWYWFGLYYRQDYRWASRALSQLRIRLLPAEKPYVVKPDEITLLRDDGLREIPSPSDLEALRRTLQSIGARRLYADRWLSAQLAATPENDWIVPQPSFMQRSIHALIEPTRAEYVVVESLGSNTVFIVERGEEALCEQRLSELGVAVRKETVPPWVILAVDTARCEPAVAAVPGLQWTGWTLFELPREDYIKQRAAWRLQHAQSAADDAARAMDIRMATQEYPAFSQFVDEHRISFARRPQPIAEFAKGLKLVSVECPSESVRPGDEVSLNYNWLCPSNTPLAGRVAFVHFETPGFRFQDDHPLFEHIPMEQVRFQPFAGEVFTEKRTVRIPPDAPSGVYEIRLGVYRADSGRRERVRSHLPTRHRALTLPTKLRVEVPPKP